MGENRDDLYIKLRKDTILIDYLAEVVNWHGFTSATGNLVAWVCNNLSQYGKLLDFEIVIIKSIWLLYV